MKFVGFLNIARAYKIAKIKNFPYPALAGKFYAHHAKLAGSPSNCGG